MSFTVLDYEDGMAHCPVEGCDWKVPEGREMAWADHRDDYHDPEVFE